MGRTILEIPIRNWNDTETTGLEENDKILEIPIRNWNTALAGAMSYVKQNIRNTYKELKQFCCKCCWWSCRSY